MSEDFSENVIDFYRKHAERFEEERNCELFEKSWLDKFLASVPEGGHVLDLGCGFGKPIAEYLIGQGYRVTGIDAVPAMIEKCREFFPDEEWVVGDMREIALEKKFDGILAWDSFFHLNHTDQANMFPTFMEHAKAGAPLLFTAGPDERGRSVNPLWGDPLFHATFSKEAYVAFLKKYGFECEDQRFNDEECGGRAVYLAKRV